MSINNDFCSGCAQKHNCESIYRTVGNTKGPSMVWKAVFIFLVPITVFVTAIVGFEFLLKEQIRYGSLRTPAVLGLAILITLAVIWLIQWLAPGWRQAGDLEQNKKDQNGHARKSDI